LADILKSLVVDSKISFDVSNFFSLTIFSAIAFIEIGFLFIIYFKATALLLHTTNGNRQSVVKQIVLIVLTNVVFIAFNSLQIDYKIVPAIILMLWMITYLLLFQN